MTILLTDSQFLDASSEDNFQIFAAHSCYFLLPTDTRFASALSPGHVQRHMSMQGVRSINPTYPTLGWRITVALGRKNYLFVGSDAGAERAAAIYSLVGSAKLNGLTPQAYLTGAA